MASCQVKSSPVGSTPAAAATDLRNQRSCVFAHSGTATSLPSQYAVWRGAWSTSAVSEATSSSRVISCRNPAFANSATKGGSRLIRSIEWSRPARRRTSCSRCASAVLGSICSSMRYAPFASFVQLLRQPALAAVVGIDVPGEYRGPARAVAAGRDQQRDRDHAPAERPEHGYDVERARKVIGSRKGPVMPALGFHAVSWPTVGHVRRAASAASPSCSSARASAAPRQ